MDETLDLELCRKIYNLLSKEPGLTLSRIAEILDVKLVYLEYHVSSLIIKENIISKNEQGYNKYYLKKKVNIRRDKRTDNTKNYIFDLIEQNPGLHLARIANMCNMSSQLAEYHLLNLEKNNLIIGLKGKNGYYKRYYIKEGEVGREEKNILSLLRQEHLIKIVLLILKNPNIKHKQLLENLDIVASTLSYHLKKLEEYDIIISKSYGKERGYEIKNKKEIFRVVRTYKLDQMVDGFKDAWQDFSLI
jgi:predicted transcriptional regulator